MKRPGSVPTMMTRHGVAFGSGAMTGWSSRRLGAMASRLVSAFGISGTPPTYIPA